MSLPMSLPTAAVKHDGRRVDECQVCGTVANVRKNFGVPSCVSCRIFYSRNTGKQLVCYQNGSCRIEGPSRKSCAACRFQKCIRAGMQKSRERKYKCKKPTAGPKLPSEAKHCKLSDSHPPMLLCKESGGFDATVMDKNLFVHFYKMAEMFRAPYDCESGQLAEGVRDTYSGLGLLEAITKRTLAVIRFLPHFSQLDRNGLSAMVSEKISGLFTILRALHFDPATGRMRMRLTGKAPALLDQPLDQIIEGLFSDLVKGEQAFMTEAELQSVKQGLTHFFGQCHLIFADRLNVGVVLLLGIYFFLPDFKTVQVDDALFRSHQSLYLRCVQDLLKGLCRSPAEAMESYNRVLLLVAEIKFVDFYFNMLSRHVRVQSDRLHSTA